MKSFTYFGKRLTDAIDGHEKAEQESNFLEDSVRPIPINRPINRSNLGRLIGRLLSAIHRYNRPPKTFKFRAFSCNFCDFFW